MRHTIHQHRIAASAISLGFMTVFLSLVHPVPSASAQQLTRPISQDNGGTVTQGQRIEIGMTPTSLSFTAQQGGSNPPAQTLTISNTGSSALRWGISHDATWLWHSPGTGTGAGTATIGVTPGALPAGTYNGQVTLWPKGAPSVTVPVTFTVTADPVSPAISASPMNLAFTATQGGSNPAAQTLSIRNTGGGTLNWRASENTGWLTLTAGSGRGNGTVTVQTTTGALAPGIHIGSIMLSGGDGVTPVAIPIAFTVTAAPVPPAIGMTPTSLSFTVQQGGGNPPVQTLTISNNGDSTLHWAVSHDAPWLSHTPGRGTGTGTVSIGATPGTLTVGTYSGHVRLWPAGAPSVTVPVTLTVTPDPVAPALDVAPLSLAFTAQQGSGNPPAQTLAIKNKGGGTLTWSVSDNSGWIVPSTGAGHATISVTTGPLKAGTYNGAITLNATGASPVMVPVTFTVTPAPIQPTLGVTPLSLAFTAQQGDGNPPPQTLAITNKGGGTLTWSVSDNSGWIVPSPATGTGAGQATISVTMGFLKPGTYSGAVTLNATGASPVTVPVTFTVTPGATTQTTTVSLSPSSLSYAATQGAANPVNQSLSLTNTGGTVNWAVSDDASWLTVSPASGTGSRTFTTSVNTAGLAGGTYNGMLTVSAAGISPKTVPVTLTVNAPATSSATLTWNANSEKDLAGYKIYRAEASGGYGAPIAILDENVTTFIASGLQLGRTYFFVITAYDSTGNESPRSNEVSKSIY